MANEEHHMADNQSGIAQYFFINYMPHEQWILPLLSRVQHSTSDTLQKRWESQRGNKFSESSLALATKFQIIDVTTNRLSDYIRQLGETFDANPDEVQRHTTGIDGQPAAYYVLDQSLPFKIAEALEAWLFEFQSLYEIWVNFVGKFSNEFLGGKINSKSFENAPEELVGNAVVRNVEKPDVLARRVQRPGELTGVSLKIENREFFFRDRARGAVHGRILAPPYRPAADFG